MMFSGNDTIIHAKREIFLKNKNNFLVRIKIYIDLNLHYHEDLPFIAFAEVIATQSGYLLISANNYVESMSRQFLIQLGYKKINYI